MKTAFIGRFQPLHLGHHGVIQEYRKDHNLIILVGSAGRKREREDPLSFQERKEVIHECFPDVRVKPLEDEERDEAGNRRWIEKIDRKYGPDAVLSGNPVVKKIVENYAEIEVLEPELESPDVYSGSAIRRRMRSGEEWRYLVPGCCEGKISELEEHVRESGIDYSFTPGWKRKNASHGTAEDHRDS